MQINVVYDQRAGSLPTGFVAAVNYVVNYFDGLFTNSVTINPPAIAKPPYSARSALDARNATYKAKASRPTSR